MFNQFTGIGNLAADVELRYTQSGKAVTSFTVCCDTGYGDNKKTEFVRCVAWDKLAIICNDFLAKGSKVMIQGPMATRKWQDQSGNDRYTTEITVREMKMLSSKSDNSDSRGIPEPAHDMGEDMPF